MSCRCGYDFRTETDGELAAVLQWHLADEHPNQPVDEWLYAKPFPEDVVGRPTVQKGPPQEPPST